MSLPNPITLAVDEANDSTTVDHVYSHAAIVGARSTYISASHSFSSRDELSFYSTPPKINGNFFGTHKATVKFTMDVEVDGIDGSTIRAPMIFEIKASLPVGVTNAQATLLRQAGLALLDRDDVMDQFHDQGIIQP